MGQADPGGSYGSGRAQEVSEKLNQSLFLYHQFCGHMSPTAVAFVWSRSENHPSWINQKFGCVTDTLMQW